MGVTLQHHGGDKPGGKALTGQVFSEGGSTFLEEPKGKVESDGTGCEGSPKKATQCTKLKPCIAWLAT